MPPFTVYKLHDMLGGRAVQNLDDYIDVDDQSPTVYGLGGPRRLRRETPRQHREPTPPAWGSFVRSGFDGAGPGGAWRPPCRSSAKSISNERSGTPGIGAFG